jgi:uncharacterized protein (TIGR00159 family)
VHGLLDFILNIRIADIADIAVVSVLLWIGISWLRTTRARLALIGLVILSGVYLLARQVGMELTAWILQAFVAASILVVVVVFQEDIRRLFEQIAVFGMRRRPLVAVSDQADTIVRALQSLADQKRGALIVIPGREPLERHLDGGIRLRGQVSEPLLLSLFDPNSPGHDGAVVLARDQIELFAAHLPLSTDHAQLGQRGTRHAAALGLAERTDALCLVVSEERGVVSAAQEGRLRVLSRPVQAADEIRGFLSRLAPDESGTSGWSRIAHGWREAAAALGVAVLLWLLAVPGSGVVVVERTARVRVNDLPAGYALEQVEPEEVEVMLSGRRRDLLLMGPEVLEVRVNAVLVELGRRTFALGPEQVSHPPQVEVVAVTPDSVKISVRERKAKPADR